MTYGTKNFSLATDPMLACSCGHPKCDKRKVKQVILDHLQQARTKYGKPMRVTSGGRCPYHPDEIGRTDTDHQMCIGVDIECSGGIERRRLVKLAIDFDYTAIGAYDGHVHFAMRDVILESAVLWVGESK